MNIRFKNTLITLFKLSFASSIIYYMLSTGKLDLKQIYSLSKNKLLFVELISTILLSYFLVSFRWYLLLSWQGIPIKLWSVIRISCIGLFFNSFMPGSVGGDLVKAYYVAKEKKEFRIKAIVTIFIDRFIGLQILMLLAFVALIFNHKTLTTNLHLKTLSITITLYIIASFLVVYALISKRVKRFFINYNFKRFFEKFPKKGLLKEIYESFHVYSTRKTNILKIVAITIPLDLIIIYIFYLLGRELGDTQMSFTSYLTIVPVGMLLMAIPLAPAGIGIGQGSFYTLFVWFGATSGKIGASVITVYQILTICVNLCFSIFYIRNKKDVKKALLAAKENSDLKSN